LRGEDVTCTHGCFGGRVEQTRFGDPDCMSAAGQATSMRDRQTWQMRMGERRSSRNSLSRGTKHPALRGMSWFTIARILLVSCFSFRHFLRTLL
jgi:hypothetical protein